MPPNTNLQILLQKIQMSEVMYPQKQIAQASGQVSSVSETSEPSACLTDTGKRLF